MTRNIFIDAVETGITEEQLRHNAISFVNSRMKPGASRMLILPPDHTRLNSMAGQITEFVYSEFAAKGIHVDIMPALGTHAQMTDEDLRLMFGSSIPRERFLVHDWRNDVVKVGKVPSSLISEWSGGKLDFEVNVEVNKIIFKGYDLILSIGQVVPHEVVGMANYTKNIMVGIGGSDTINKSHYLGASCNMEKIMGRTDSPVRKLFDYGVSTFLKDLPISYIQTVIGKYPDGKRKLCGLFCGETREVFERAAELSRKVNLQLLDKPVRKIVAYLDPDEFRSTWLGNKSVYRTRMTIADNGELIVLAPGLREFGEDKEIDRLIRKYGYKGTPATLRSVRENEDLRANLGAAAHLIHGSSEGRFKIIYCPGSLVSKEEILSIGFDYAQYDQMSLRYNPKTLKDGFNTMPDGEEIFFISNPALGLWALKSNFV